MEVRYKGGHVVPPNVLRALSYLGKVGIMTRKTWYEHFSQGSLRWKQQQLQLLIERKLIRIHPCGSVPDAFVLTPSGCELVRELKWHCVPSISPQYIEHDETIAKGLLSIEKMEACRGWFTDKELKSYQMNNFLIPSKNSDVKYPDAILKLFMKGDERVIAIEYERTGKAFSRYRSILWLYRSFNELTLVLYIVEDETIKKRIKAALRFLGDAEFTRKIVFMNAEDWKRNSLESDIEFITGKRSLKNWVTQNAA